MIRLPYQILHRITYKTKLKACNFDLYLNKMIMTQKLKGFCHKNNIRCIEKVSKYLDVHTIKLEPKLFMCKLNLMLSHGVEILLKGETSIFLSGIGNRLCRKKKILRKYWLNHLKCLSNIHDHLNITFKTVLDH